MTKYLLGLLLSVAPFSASFAQCDLTSLTNFRGLCDIPARDKASRRTPLLMDCGGTSMYVTYRQYEDIMRYQRASVNMALKVNGEFVTSPCVPAGY